MNKERRKRIEEIQDKILGLQADLQWIKEEEEEAYDNLPDGIRDGERGDAMQDAIDAMENADSSLQDAYDNLSDVL